MIRLITHLDIYGFSWGFAYWFGVLGLGLLMAADNLRHAWRQVHGAFTTQENGKPLRRSTLGYLAVHVVLTVFLLTALVIGVTWLRNAYLTGLHLQFANQASELLIRGVLLSFPAAPTLVVSLFWLWRWWTVRALK